MWILKAFGIALATTLILFAFDVWVLSNTSKATGFIFVRARGVFLMYVGLFQAALGLLISRVDLVSDGGSKVRFVLR